MSGFKKGLKDGIPIALGYLSVSFTFGLQGVKGGLSWWETVLISICNVTSAGQFAGLDIMLSGGRFLDRNGLCTVYNQPEICPYVNISFTEG